MRTIKKFLGLLIGSAVLAALLACEARLGTVRIPASERGELVQVVRHGPFTIEQRKYLDGPSAHRTTSFCDYRLTFDGMPIQLDSFDFVNHYNSCQALLLLVAEEPTFVIGSSFDSVGGGYLPVIVSTNNGVLNVDRRRACAMQFGHEGHSQAWKGWTVKDGRITLCGKEWRVIQPS